MSRPLQEDVGRVCTINEPINSLEEDVHRIVAIGRIEGDYAYVLESIETNYVSQFGETSRKIGDVTLLNN